MNTVISVRIDKETKLAAQEVAKSAGLNLSTLVNAYLRQVVATRRIEIYAPEPMTPHLKKIIAQVEAEVATVGLGPTYDTPEEFLADLNSSS